MSRPKSVRKTLLNRFTEEHLLSVASYACRLSEGNVLLIGGALSLPQVSGYPKLRPRSEDLDFIVNDEGLNALCCSNIICAREGSITGSPEMGGYLAWINDVTMVFFHGTIRGYPLSDEIFGSPVFRKTSEGVVATIRNELNIALKIRRGLTRGGIYGKDKLDFASAVLGLKGSGEDFDASLLSDFMSPDVCNACQIGEPYGCMSAMSEGAHNLRAGDRTVFFSKVKECAERLEDVCRYTVTPPAPAILQQARG